MERIAPATLGLGKLFSTIRDAVIVGDPQSGLIVLWNDAAARIFGYSAEEAIGSPMEMLVPDSLKERHRNGLRRYAGTGHGPLVESGNIVELPAIRKDGSEIFVELTLTPIEGPHLSGRFAMALIRDATEKKHRSEELERANAELQAVNLAMRDFVAAASHDLRSPITTIAGFATVLTTRWDTTAEDDKRQYLEVIERQAAQMSRLVDDLLTISKVEAGALTATKVETNLEEAIARCLESFSDDAQVETSVQPRLTVTVDPDHLHRILVNLVGNAIRYGQPPVRVAAAAVDGTVEVKVMDAGPGVPEDFVPRLFQKFSRADTEAGRREEGSGLGLSIVRGLAQANDGEVTYEALDPHGSCFTVRLQCMPDPTPAAHLPLGEI